MFEIIVWLLLIEIIGLLSIPIVQHLFRNLNDKGLCISKIFGILLLSYFVWLISFVLGFNLLSIALSFLILCSISIFLLKTKPIKNFDIKNFIKLEAIFIISFLIFLLIRAYNPDLYLHEKFQDTAFLTAITRTESLPPYDPWLSGYNLNYYYFGYFIVSVLSKITSLPTTISYNLAVPLIFALAATIIYGIGYEFTRKTKYALLFVLLVLIAGNMIGFIQPFCRGSSSAFCLSFSDGVNFDSSYFWTSSRVIKNTINEFPYFSFLVGDLHPHYMSIPFQLMLIFLLFNFFKSPFKNKGLFKNMIFLSFVIGAFIPLSGWEFPTYLFLLISLTVIKMKKIFYKRIKFFILVFFYTILLSMLLYSPFIFNTKSAIAGIGFVQERTGIQFYLAIFGAFLLPLILFLYKNSKFKESRKRNLILLTLATIPIAIVLNFQLLVLLLPIALLSIYAIKNKNDEIKFISILILFGILISLLCEIFFFVDGLSPTYGRMNTVFKYYIQVWLLFAIATAFSMYNLRNKISKMLFIPIILLIVATLFYPILATLEITNNFSNLPSLDGSTFLKKWSEDEYSAINWINKNIKGSPIILEREGIDYPYSKNSYVGRVSSFTGLPTIIGQPGHEYTWRLTEPAVIEDINLRVSDVRNIYNSDIENALSLIKEYNVKYVYVGLEERAEYRGINPKFDEKFSNPKYFEKVFDSTTVQIYKVKQTD